MRLACDIEQAVFHKINIRYHTSVVLISYVVLRFTFYIASQEMYSASLCFVVV